MIISYEVGAVFKLIDQATPALDKLFVKFNEFDKLISGALSKIGQFDKAILGLGFSSQPALEKAASNFGMLDKAIDTSIVRVGTLRGELTAVAEQTAVVARGARAAAGPAAIGGRGGVYTRPTRAGGGAGGAGGGIHLNRMHVPLPGGSGMSFGGNATLAALGLIGYGVMEEAEIRDIAAKALITGQVHVDAGMSNFAAFKTLRDVIQRNAALGGFSPKEVGGAVLGSERQFAGLKFDKRMEVLNTMLPFAMQEARLKESGLKESAEALVGLSHMTGTYDTAKLPDLYRKFTYASQLTPKSLTEYTRAMSYSMPSLVGGMGMDPDAIMFLTAMNQAAGIGSSKAGTWIQSFFSELMPSIGPNLTKGQKRHNDALRKLGLIDEASDLTWQVKGQNGKTDWLSSLMKLSPLLGEKLAGMPDVGRMEVIEDIFGKQGGREAGLMNLPEFIGQFPQLAQQLKMAKGGEDVLTQLGEASPVMQTRKVWAELQNVLMDIGQVALPPVVAGLKGFDAALHGLVAAVGSFSNPQGDLLHRGILGHLGDAWEHVKGYLSGSSMDAATTNMRDIERQRRVRAQALNPLADLPSVAATEKAGNWPPGITADMFGGPSGATVVHDGVLQALKDWAGQGGGDGGGGGGFVGGFGGRYGHGPVGRGTGTWSGNLGRTDVGWSMAGATPQLRAEFIRKTAAALGIDPNTALRVAQSEGFYKYVGDVGNGPAYGDFQLNVGRNRMGDLFKRVTRLDPADPKNWQAMDKFALGEAKKHGWGQWFGAARVGIRGMMGIGTYHGPTPGVDDGVHRAFRAGSDRFMPPVGVDSSHDRISSADLTMRHRTAAASQVGHVYLSGAKVGKVMWGEMHRAVQGPSIGSQTPDGSRGHYGSGSSYNVSFA